MMKLICFNCGFCYLPKKQTPCLDGYTEKSKIHINRYGQNKYGKNLEYFVCTDCDSFSLVQVSLLKIIPSLFGISSPYSLISKPVHIDEIAAKANSIFDKTGDELEIILETNFGIPPHVSSFLKKQEIITFDELGIRFRGRYCHIHTSYFRTPEQEDEDDIRCRQSQIKESQKKLSTDRVDSKISKKHRDVAQIVSDTLKAGNRIAMDFEHALEGTTVYLKSLSDSDLLNSKSNVLALFTLMSSANSAFEDGEDYTQTAINISHSCRPMVTSILQLPNNEYTDVEFEIINISIDLMKKIDPSVKDTSEKFQDDDDIPF